MWFSPASAGRHLTAPANLFPEGSEVTTVCLVCSAGICGHPHFSVASGSTQQDNLFVRFWQAILTGKAKVLKIYDILSYLLMMFTFPILGNNVDQSTVNVHPFPNF